MISAMSLHDSGVTAKAREIIEKGREDCRMSMCSADDFKVMFPGEVRPSKKIRNAKSPYRKSQELRHWNVWWLTGFYEEQGRIRAAKGTDYSSARGSGSFAEKCRMRGAEMYYASLRSAVLA